MANKEIKDLVAIPSLALDDKIPVSDTSDTDKTKYYTPEQMMDFILGRQVRVTPTGTIDGVNKVFTLPSTPRTGALFVLEINGWDAIEPDDYTRSGTTLTLVEAPETSAEGTDKLRAIYFI